MITDTASAASRGEVGPFPGPERGRRNVIGLPARAHYVVGARCLLRPCGVDPETVGSAALVVSEPACNAVRHGHGRLLARHRGA